MWERFTLIISMMGCLIIASNYRSLKKIEERKLFGACLGFFVIFVVCGEHIVHPMFITLINILLIMQDDKRFVHFKSLGISFVYLSLMHSDVISVPKAAIDVQMFITLRLVGVCFELNTSYLINNRGNLDSETLFYLNDRTLTDIKDTEYLPIIPDLYDIVMYVYNFVGILKGPYYSWKTFKNYFDIRFENYDTINSKISKKVDNIPVTLVMYVWLNVFYPLNMQYYDDSPFDISTFWWCYNIPRLLIVHLHYYMVTSICEATCMEAGLGVYPAACQPEPGFGPTTNISFLRHLEETGNYASSERYNYDTVKIFGEYVVFTEPKMRKTLKYCDMTTQFWFWSNIYRRIPIDNKQMRSTITLITWGAWRGLNLANTLLVMTILLYIHTEDIFSEIVEKRFNITNNPIQTGTYIIFKLMCFLYISPLFYNLDTKDIIKYFNSTRWSFHIFLSILYFCGLFIKSNTTESNSSGQTSQHK